LLGFAASAAAAGSAAAAAAAAGSSAGNLHPLSLGHRTRAKSISVNFQAVQILLLTFRITAGDSTVKVVEVHLLSFTNY
jgi:hypothetical protein